MADASGVEGGSPSTYGAEGRRGGRGGETAGGADPGVQEAGRGGTRRPRRSATQEMLRRETKGWRGGGAGRGGRGAGTPRASRGRSLRGGGREGEAAQGQRPREEERRPGSWRPETEEAGRGRAAGETAACLRPGGPGDSKSKPRRGPGEEWLQRPPAKCRKVAPVPRLPNPPTPGARAR